MNSKSKNTNILKENVLPVGGEEREDGVRAAGQGLHNLTGV